MRSGLPADALTTDSGLFELGPVKRKQIVASYKTFLDPVQNIVGSCTRHSMTAHKLIKHCTQALSCKDHIIIIGMSW